ncbi:MAG: universal stress protein [Solirubrobacteraceae bacterium]
MAATPGPILVCFDGSPDAAEAIRAAGALMSGREAIVLSVAIPAEAGFPLEPLGEIVGRLSSVYRDWDEIAAEVAERQAQAGCALAVDAGLRARPMTAVGKPAATILRVAAEQDVAAIVLGSRRHGALDGLLGGVAIRVVAQADRPVVLIPRISGA